MGLRDLKLNLGWELCSIIMSRSFINVVEMNVSVVVF